MYKSISLILLVALLAQCSPLNNDPNDQGSETTNVESHDPLPSWIEGSHRDRIIKFVESATDPNNPDFVPVAERIATFDNDGTLWSEQPMYFQLYFAIDRARQIGYEDLDGALAGGLETLYPLLNATHTGMTAPEFKTIVEAWVDTARHPESGKRYTEMVYQPMLELLDYLRANEFKTYIVSGGGLHFMRPWTESVYGIPAEQVVGTRPEVVFENDSTGPVIRRTGALEFLNDKEGKVVSIYHIIGHTPIMSVGNSDGDLAMLQYSTTSPYKSLQVYIHHTDSLREWAYDRDCHVGSLDAGLDQATRDGWLVVDMKSNWKTIYPE